MKKAYISPSLLEFRVELQAMIAASTLDQTQDNPSVTVKDEEYNEPFSGRRVDVWGDEEEEDY